MKAPSFNKWFARLPLLNQPQRKHTLAALQLAVGLDQVTALIEQAGSAHRVCRIVPAHVTTGMAMRTDCSATVAALVAAPTMI